MNKKKERKFNKDFSVQVTIIFSRKNFMKKSQKSQKF